jgi:hypothetical protein
MKDGKLCRLEVQSSKKALNPMEIMSYIINEAVRLSETEYRNETYFEELHNSLAQLETQIDYYKNLGIPEIQEIKEDQITMLYQLGQIQKDFTSIREIQSHSFNELNENYTNHMKLMDKLTENQNLLIQSQNMLIHNIQLLQENLSTNLESIYNQNRELHERIEIESQLIQHKIKKLTWSYKIKRFWIKIKQIFMGRKENHI